MTSRREKVLLNAADVRSIIVTCGESNVAKLKFGDLEVEFAPKCEPPAPKPDSLPAPAAEIAAIQEKVEQSSIECDEIALREEQVAEMMLTNPAQAEELLARGELEDDGD
jgi:hypothetical protein